MAARVRGVAKALHRVRPRQYLFVNGLSILVPLTSKMMAGSNFQADGVGRLVQWHLHRKRNILCIVFAESGQACGACFGSIVCGVTISLVAP